MPDLDFDGVDDLVIAAKDDWARNPPVGDAGVVYCYSGADGRLLYSVTSMSPFQFDEFGYRVAGIQDLDGDGAGDFLVGALFENSVYVFSGAEGTLMRTMHSPNPSPCGFGRGLAVMSDLDGDGVDDIAITADCEFGYGRIHVFSGASGAFRYSLVSPGQGNGTRNFGTYVVGVPDIDGDGAGEILVGDPWVNRPGPAPNTHGAAYLFSGAAGALLHTLECPVPPFFFGTEIASVPDVDGDGIPDLAVGAEQQDSVHVGAGQVYLYSGASGLWLRTFSSPNEINGSNFGNDLFGCSDADGDGRGDLLIGAPNEVPPGYPPSSGRAYLISGATGATIRAFDSPLPVFAGLFGIYMRPLSSGGANPEFGIAISAYHCPGTCNPWPRGRTYIYRFCRADWNYDGVVDSRDFFDFVLAFFGDRADFNADSVTDTRDFFEFLSAFFADCDP